MKKLFSLIACLLCAAMLATVGFAADAAAADTSQIAPISNPVDEGRDAYSIYKRASRNLDSVDSVEMSGTTRTVMEMEGVPLGTVLQNSRIRMLTPSDGDIQMAMNSAVKTMVLDSAETMTIEIYYKDGYMYTKAGDETSKTKLDIKDMYAQSNNLDTDLPREAFKDASVEETDNGTRIKFKISLSDLTNSASFMSDLGGLINQPDSDIKFSDMSYSMLIGSDNTLKSYDVAFDMDMTVEGVTVKAKNTASFMILAVNSVDKINFPDGLAAY